MLVWITLTSTVELVHSVVQMLEPVTMMKQLIILTIVVITLV